jgi:hypothetical protein
VQAEPAGAPAEAERREQAVAEREQAEAERERAEAVVVAAEEELAETGALAAADRLIARIAKPNWSALGARSGMVRIKSAWLRTAG